MTEIIVYSSILTDITKTSSGAVDIIGAVEGSKAYGAGIEYTFTKESIEKCAKSWINGYINVNHNHNVKYQNEGKILESYNDNGKARMVLSLNNNDIIDHRLFSGFSQECNVLKTDDKNNILEFQGLGVSLLIAIEPACTMKQGCKIIKSEIEYTFADYAGSPFGEYKDFADCVNKNKDKDNPEAYCGYIKHKIEGEKGSTSKMLINTSNDTTSYTASNGTITITPNITVIPNTWTGTSTSSHKACPRDNSVDGAKPNTNDEINNRGESMDEEMMKKCKEEMEKTKSENMALKSDITTLKSEKQTLVSENVALRAEKTTLDTRVSQLDSEAKSMKTALDSATTKLTEIETVSKKEIATEILSMDKAHDEKILMSMGKDALTILRDSIKRVSSGKGPNFDAGSSLIPQTPSVGGYNSATGKWGVI